MESQRCALVFINKCRGRSMVRGIRGKTKYVLEYLENILILIERNNSPWHAPNSPPWVGRNLNPGAAEPRQLSPKAGTEHLPHNKSWAGPVRSEGFLPEGNLALEQKSRDPYARGPHPSSPTPIHDSGGLPKAFELTCNICQDLIIMSWIEWLRKICFLCSFCFLLLDRTFHFQGSCFWVRM